MKVLQINNYHFIKGGSERVYLDTSSLLSRNGHSVVHFSVNDEGALGSPTKEFFVKPVSLRPNNLIDYIKLVLSFFYNKEAAKKLDKLLRVEKPDVAHLHIFYGRLTNSILPVLKRHQIPVVMSVHEYRMICPAYVCYNRGSICTKCMGKYYIHCVVGRCNKGSLFNSLSSALECYIRDICFSYKKYISKFIMVSSFINDLHFRYGTIDKSKSVVLHNFSTSVYDEPAKNLGYYLYLGRVSFEKGVETLLDAWTTFPLCELRIAGDGPMLDKLMKKKESDNLGSVSFLGHISGSVLHEQIRNAKAVICPSEWYENNPMSVIEALCAGVPVIGADIGGIPELIIHEKNGFLFKSGDVLSLTECIKHVESLTDVQIEDLRERAIAYAKAKFNEGDYLRSIVQIYEQAIYENSGITSA